MNAKQAQREAMARRNNQDGNNADESMEFAFSPSTGAVGCRHRPDRQFRVFNVNYPRYRDDDGITDWRSVGVARAIGERGPRRFL